MASFQLSEHFKQEWKLPGKYRCHCKAWCYSIILIEWCRVQYGAKYILSPGLKSRPAGTEGSNVWPSRPGQGFKPCGQTAEINVEEMADKIQGSLLSHMYLQEAKQMITQEREC